jgi:hypothetical protein
MHLLGIDENRNERCDRNWEAVRTFFKNKLPELKRIRDEKHSGHTAKEKLLSAVLAESVETLERQLFQMSFFHTAQTNGSENSDPPLDEEKLKYAPITNMGCEGEFAKLDNRIRFSGGSTALATHSRKNVISTNGLLVDTSFTDLDDEERRKRWSWARSSKEVNDAKKLERHFLATVKETLKLAILKKAELKQKKAVRIQKLLDSCKAHGGPLTASSLEHMYGLSEKELLHEIAYIRVTIAPDIKQMKRIVVDGKIKMQKFSVDQLREQIKNTLKPESDLRPDLNELLLSVLSV